MKKPFLAMAKIFGGLIQFLWNTFIVIFFAFLMFVAVPYLTFLFLAYQAQGLVENPSLRFQFWILLLFLPLVITIVNSMMSEDVVRALMRRTDELLGNWYALVYPVFFLALTLPYFSGLSCTLKSTHLIKTVPDFAISDSCVLRFSLFYVWHVLDAIPLLKIPQTMQWAAPHVYTDAFSGLILIVFKVSIIFPFVQAYVVWRKNRTKKEEKSDFKEVVKNDRVLTTGKT